MEEKEYTVGKGWRSLVDEAIQRLEKLGVKVDSCYEKYGTLRFNVYPEPREATNILNEMEDRSQHICERCGATGQEVDIVEIGGWIKALCPTCTKQWKESTSLGAVEQYMEKHQFLEADKVKVREFLREEGATSAYLTRNDLHYITKSGIPGIVGRGLLGIQDNLILDIEIESWYHTHS